MRIVGIVVAWSIFSLMPDNLMGQRGYTARTAEYLAGTSDLIVRATILDLQTKDYVPKNREEERSASNFRTVRVILNVTRCLKGTTDQSIRFQITQAVGDTRLTKWKQSKTELFWFFDVAARDKNGITKILPRSEFELWKSVVEPPNMMAKRPPIRLLDIHLQPLTTEKIVQDSIVQFVEQFGNEKIEGTSISVSREIAERSGMAQASNRVLLPSNYKELRSK